MADEPIDATQAILRNIQEGVAKLQERAEKTDATIARGHADNSRNIAKMHADILSMHADVAEARAVSREVAVRLTLLEKRSADIEAKVSKIYDHLGLVDA
jgi:hypothetical protein